MLYLLVIDVHYKSSVFFSFDGNQPKILALYNAPDKSTYLREYDQC